MKKFTTWSLVVLLSMSLIPVFSPLVKAYPSTWYVSPKGSDSNIGDFVHPFKTLQKAINVSSPSDTIYLRGGNYNNIYPKTQGILINKGGTAGAWYTIAGYPGERAVLNGAGHPLQNGYALLRIGTSSAFISYVRITNLVIENVTAASTSSAGILACAGSRGASNHIRIDNCTIQNCAHRGLEFWSNYPDTAYLVNNITVENCIINNTNTDPASMHEGVTFCGCKDISFHDNINMNCPKIMLDLGGNTKNGKIFKNTFITKVNSGIKLDGSQSVSPAEYVSNISIYDNLFSGVGQTGLKIGCEYTGGCNNITVYNNIFNMYDPSGGSQDGIALQRAAHYTTWFSDITIKYNTICIGKNGYPLNIAIERTKMKNIYIANNIFQSNSIGSYQITAGIYANSTDSCFHFYNNLYDHTSKRANTAWKDGTGKFEATAIRGDPEFVNRKGGNFHLNSTSSAIDAADSTYTISTDYDGCPRPQKKSYDIGAYEYYTDTAVTPVITNVKITPGPQQRGGYLNISCNVIDNRGGVDEVWVNITYPDHTTHNFSMNPRYYFNQTYSQIGTYQFFIWADDTNRNRNISRGHMFQIIPALSNAFLIGMISDANDSSGSVISIKTKVVLYIGFNPFSFNVLSSNEKIFVSKNYAGYISTKFIIGVFNAAVLSEKSTNDPLQHRILNRFT